MRTAFTARMRRASPIYNWSYVDQIYDGLLDNGIRPFVEISFMPKALAANAADPRVLVQAAIRRRPPITRSGTR